LHTGCDHGLFSFCHGVKRPVFHVQVVEIVQEERLANIDVVRTVLNFDFFYFRNLLSKLFKFRLCDSSSHRIDFLLKRLDPLVLHFNLDIGFGQKLLELLNTILSVNFSLVFNDSGSFTESHSTDRLLVI
jgi:hypothetical protein